MEDFDIMTKQQYHLENRAAIEFVRLMLRLGVRMRA
jgi:hypothetical protein